MIIRLANFLLLLFGLSLVAICDGKDLYATLGVSPDATPEQIQKAYRLIADKARPATEIQNAYDILNDAAQRKRYDTYRKKYRATWDGSFSEVDSMFRAALADQDKQRLRESYRLADARAQGRHAPALQYDESTHRFYDTRTRKWFHWSPLQNLFTSDEGWILYEGSGDYYSSALVADWTPEKGWYRKVSNGNDNYIRIDPQTGFALSVKYEPKTTSDASALFEEFFNPIRVIDEREGRGNRTALFEKLSQLPWTATQTADYLERANAHIRVLQHPDMIPKFATDWIYTLALAQAVLDNPFSLRHPEIVETFIRELPKYHEELASSFLNKDEWHTHPNANRWMAEFFKHEYGTKHYLYQIFANKPPINDGIRRLNRFYPLLKKVGMTPRVLEALLDILNQYGAEGFEAFKEPLLELACGSVFRELVAYIDSKNHRPLLSFLRWYEKYRPSESRAFQRALAMPGTSRDEFWKLTPDHREFIFHEKEFNVARSERGAARIKFLDSQLALCTSLPELKPHAKSTTAADH